MYFTVAYTSNVCCCTIYTSLINPSQINLPSDPTPNREVPSRNIYYSDIENHYLLTDGQPYYRSLAIFYNDKS